ncbi:MAG TPA: 3-dehydroquinate synthase, partial [Bacteroidota bacterium]|nr:3-dehydroquinate synthase [Bacteroidota bacterium]
MRVSLPKDNFSYDIQIGVSLTEAAKDILRRFPESKKFIITDSNVRRLYGRKLIRMLHQPLRHLLAVPAGEKSKSRKIKDLLENKLLQHHADRHSIIIALGGGMIGDLAGFVAATLFRGIPLIQIPTSLLAQVDSSVGGKVAIDHPLGKNLLGAFHQPRQVYIDVSVLKTLPDREFRSGLAEVIKYGAILDADFFKYIERNHQKILKRNHVVLTTMIQRCCELKRNVVQKDERESGLRKILNFGHTFGHAIETLSQYRLLHGEAISIGMVLEAKLSTRITNLPLADLIRLESILR